MSYYDKVGLPTPPPALVPDPDFPALAELHQRLWALLDADDIQGFKALMRAEGERGEAAFHASETKFNPLYWDFREHWHQFDLLVARFRFRSAKAYYLEHLHPHVGEQLGWIDPLTLGDGKRAGELTDDERMRMWNALWGHLLAQEDDDGDTEDESHERGLGPTAEREENAAKVDDARRQGDRDPLEDDGGAT